MTVNRQKQYDYIIAGAGCAGLSLLLRIIRNPALSNKKILLIDKDDVKSNDRTWCFWEKEPGFFENLVYRQWSRLDFFGENYEEELDILPYHYKMIKGQDFYTYCFSEIKKHPQVDFLYDEIKDITTKDSRSFIRLANQTLDAGNALVFTSIHQLPPSRKNDITLLQHFKGWVIQTEQPVFAIHKATLMDFRVHQQHGTSFSYVLPLDEQTALVEYTLFTPTLLEKEQYDKELNDYITHQLQISAYTIKEEEYGVIPMTSFSYPFYKNGAYHIGTAGGQTKASTGYTFRFIQKQSQQIADCLATGRSPLTIPTTPSRFRFYDNTLLHILYHNQLPGKKIFSDLFRKNDPACVLRFLDNESSFKDEWKIISSLPTWPFLKAAFTRH
ncbi:MAG TPA: lycopene cyclase family protein [Chitinophagaceae bacterium]|nr:lycopene cyclase family protein [Chitinophagaceae bacterium]